MNNSFLFSMNAIWLAIVILVIGDYVSGMRLRSDWFSPLLFMAMCEIGWWGAFWFAVIFADYEWLNVIGSGVIGGICVAIGLTLTWKLNQIRIVITTITLAGLLGALPLQLDWGLRDHNPFDWLFWVWQPIVLLGIGIAVQIDSAKSSAEQ